MTEWLSSWLAEQEVWGSIPQLATWISEIGYLLLPSSDMAEIPLKRRKSSIQPTNQLLTEITGHTYALFWGQGDYSNRYTSMNTWIRHWENCMVNGILLNNMKCPYREYSMAFWIPTSYSDFPNNQTLYQYYEFDTGCDIYRIARDLEHLQGAWHASRGHLPFRKPFAVSFFHFHMLSLMTQFFPSLYLP